MRTFTGFFSIIALGLIAGAVLATTMSHSVSQFIGNQGSETGFKIDSLSLLMGIILGALLTNLASMEWSRIPRRLAAWLVDNSDNFGYLAVAIVLIAIVIYY